MNKNYKVKCRKEHKILFFSVTHNGDQWASIVIREPEHEIPKMIKVLQDRLDKIRKQKET